MREFTHLILTGTKKGASLTAFSGKNIMKDALEIRGRENPSNEENISAEKEEKKEDTRILEKDVYRQRQEGIKPQEEKRTSQVMRLRPLVGLNFLKEV